MAFVDGEKTGFVCPKCGKDLIYSKSFRDMFSHMSGHYTVDEHLIVCENDDCSYTEDYTDPKEAEAEKAWEQEMEKKMKEADD